MSYSLILQTASRFLLPLLLLLSLFLLIRGHNEPGGGFIAGLVASAAIALDLFSHGIQSARRVLGADPRTVLGVGLALALASGAFGAFAGDAFFTSEWWTLSLPVLGEVKLGSPFLFDIGVYLVVIGASLTMVLSLAQEEE